MSSGLIDRHKQWIMKGWHAMCLRSHFIKQETNMPQQPIPPKTLTWLSDFSPGLASSSRCITRVGILYVALIAQWRCSLTDKLSATMQIAERVHSRPKSTDLKQLSL